MTTRTAVSRYAVLANYPAGNRVVMTLHVGHATSPTSVEITEILTVLSQWISLGLDGGPALKDIVSTSCSFEAVTGQKIRPLPVAAPLVLPVTGTGNVAGDGLPPQIAICVSLRTGLAGRRTRGRMYVFGIAESWSGSDGTISSANARAVANCFEGLRTRIDTVATGELGVFSRLNDSAESVESVFVGQTLDTQRRRRLKDLTYLGENIP